MDHLAILSKQKNLLSKIISGRKTIESRWYKFKKTPYENISINDIIYFKESGEPVTIIAQVSKVLFFKDLHNNKINEILKKYGEQICVPLSYANELISKKYCTLIFLDNVKPIVPFQIDKRGYGLMTAWITVNNINSIRK
ncbi:MAG: hypothetical protein KKF52_04855 [Nanoarchaeota archaeon]|nr:hypothetical protein [Nanoarchaeota archaeon]MBU4242532.1 hypothetical protein [Nanoarchaeota archaeon]MBU4351551.1 hypothetical protein [Nanoarchaeota archaeon]